MDTHGNIQCKRLCLKKELSFLFHEKDLYPDGSEFDMPLDLEDTGYQPKMPGSTKVAVKLEEKEESSKVREKTSWKTKVKRLFHKSNKEDAPSVQTEKVVEVSHRDGYYDQMAKAGSWNSLDTTVPSATYGTTLLSSNFNDNSKLPSSNFNDKKLSSSKFNDAPKLSSSKFNDDSKLYDSNVDAKATTGSGNGVSGYAAYTRNAKTGVERNSIYSTEWNVDLEPNGYGNAAKENMDDPALSAWNGHSDVPVFDSKCTSNRIKVRKEVEGYDPLMEELKVKRYDKVEDDGPVKVEIKAVAEKYSDIPQHLRNRQYNAPDISKNRTEMQESQTVAVEIHRDNYYDRLAGAYGNYAAAPNVSYAPPKVKARVDTFDDLFIDEDNSKKRTDRVVQAHDSTPEISVHRQENRQQVINAQSITYSMPPVLTTYSPPYEKTQNSQDAEDIEENDHVDHLIVRKISSLEGELASLRNMIQRKASNRNRKIASAEKCKEEIPASSKPQDSITNSDVSSMAISKYQSSVPTRFNKVRVEKTDSFDRLFGHKAEQDLAYDELFDADNGAKSEAKLQEKLSTEQFINSTTSYEMSPILPSKDSAYVEAPSEKHQIIVDPIQPAKPRKYQKDDSFDALFNDDDDKGDFDSLYDQKNTATAPRRQTEDFAQHSDLNHHKAIAKLDDENIQDDTISLPDHETKVSGHESATLSVDQPENLANLDNEISVHRDVGKKELPNDNCSSEQLEPRLSSTGSIDEMAKFDDSVPRQPLVAESTLFDNDPMDDASFEETMKLFDTSRASKKDTLDNVIAKQKEPAQVELLPLDKPLESSDSANAINTFAETFKFNLTPDEDLGRLDSTLDQPIPNDISTKEPASKTSVGRDVAFSSVDRNSTVHLKIDTQRSKSDKKSPKGRNERASVDNLFEFDDSFNASTSTFDSSMNSRQPLENQCSTKTSTSASIMDDLDSLFSDSMDNIYESNRVNDAAPQKINKKSSTESSPVKDIFQREAKTSYKPQPKTSKPKINALVMDDDLCIDMSSIQIKRPSVVKESQSPSLDSTLGVNVRKQYEPNPATLQTENLNDEWKILRAENALKGRRAKAKKNKKRTAGKSSSRHSNHKQAIPSATKTSDAVEKEHHVEIIQSSEPIEIQACAPDNTLEINKGKIQVLQLNAATSDNATGTLEHTNLTRPTRKRKPRTVK